MARIVFDARTLASARTGIGRFLEGLVRALAIHAPEHEYRLLTDRAFAPGLALSGELLAPWLPQQLWEAVALPRAARRIGADVLHLPHEGFVGPKWRALRVVTVHDLIPLHFQERYMRNRAHAAWYRARLNAVRRQADVVLTVSQATSRELQDVLGIEPERMRVIYTPVDARFVVSRAAQQFVEQRFDLGGNSFYLAVGSADPRKNLIRVLQAHARYARGKNRPKQLVLFGHPWRGLAISELVVAHGAPGLVRELGGVTDEELVALYNMASAIVFPSTYEGYGLPIVEAMACGCPVITSSGGALAEAAGGAALLVDPTSVAELATSMERLAIDDAERTRMTLGGLAWAPRATWEHASKAVLRAYGLV